jgi:hypothetical protein
MQPNIGEPGRNRRGFHAQILTKLKRKERMRKDSEEIYLATRSALSFNLKHLM